MFSSTMTSGAVVVQLLVIWTTSTSGHEGHEHYVPRADQGEDLADQRFTRDTRHIKEDIEAYFQMNISVVDQLSPENLDYYYFVLHDFDRNSKLDGLEMMKAIQHAVDHAEHLQGENEPSSEDKLQHFVTVIDHTLQEDDLDKDGFLSYPEFTIAQKRYQLPATPAAEVQPS